MEVGAGLPHDDWIGGRWIEGWKIGIKLPCGSFRQYPNSTIILSLWERKYAEFKTTDMKDSSIYTGVYYMQYKQENIKYWKEIHKHSISSTHSISVRCKNWQQSILCPYLHVSKMLDSCIKQKGALEFFTQNLQHKCDMHVLYGMLRLSFLMKHVI
jgi:hypothetical protein